MRELPVHIRLILGMLSEGAKTDETLERAHVAVRALVDAQTGKFGSRRELMRSYKQANEALQAIQGGNSRSLVALLSHKAFARDVCAWLGASLDDKDVAPSSVQDAQIEFEHRLHGIAMDLATNAPLACEKLQCILADRSVTEPPWNDCEGVSGSRDAIIFGSACIGTLLVVLVAMLLDR